MNLLTHTGTCRNKTCMATSVRLNSDRSITGTSEVKAKQRSVRLDLVLLKNNLEFGCSELGTNVTSILKKKEIVEVQLHSPKLMKGMFCAVAAKAENSLDVIRALKIVCLNETGKRKNTLKNLFFLNVNRTQGLTMSPAVMHCPAGHVCRIVQSTVSPGFLQQQH